MSHDRSKLERNRSSDFIPAPRAVETFNSAPRASDGELAPSVTVSEQGNTQTGHHFSQLNVHPRATERSAAVAAARAWTDDGAPPDESRGSNDSEQWGDGSTEQQTDRVDAREELGASMGRAHVHARRPLRAKLDVSQPGDSLEQEAERIADEVMRMAAPYGASPIAARGTQRGESQPPAERVVRQIQREAIAAQEVPDAPPQAIAATQRAGRPLDPSTMSFMEPRFGFDFSHVRIHADSESAAAASSVRARAYTIGSDIVFGDGKYQPQTFEGQRLLAHELTHVMQQGTGGQGSMGVATYRSVARMLQRDGDADKEKDKFKGPAPDTPFELTNSEKVVIEKLAANKLRVLAAAAAGNAYVNFGLACEGAKNSLARQEKEEAEAQQKMLEFVFGAVGMLLGPVGSAIGAKAAGPAVQTELLDTLRKQLPGLELPGGMVNGVLIPARRIPSGLEAAIASDTVTNLAAKLSPEKATSLVEGAAGKVGSAAAKIPIGNRPHQMAISFVEKMQESAHASKSALDATIAAADDVGALLGIHGRFVSATPAVYRAEVDTKAQHFLEQVGRTASLHAEAHGVALVDAYGRLRLCTYSSTSDDLLSGISYRFQSWVTPDMEPTVLALNPNPKRMSGSDFRGGIPEPTMDASQGKAGGQTIVRMNAYGGSRLAVVTAASGLFDTKGTYKFVRWIPADEEAENIAKGALQMAGIPQLDPTKIDGHIPEPPK